ncbi:uncharacterized protein LOC129743407 [Uranotaenia lowii]|uniref:uncharacterized protein LOC129743407 n=1 Tax=Uranotaenia lowii TaxID=190385 RepID=UPI00247A01A9|nr:uncharacterized protein LOC129743407 [Uranotaenia lowii]
MGPRKNRIDTGCDCDVCDRPNYAKTWMVECMGCRKWLHYDCANVTPGVKHRTFYCLKCTGGNTTPTNSRNTGARKKQADPVLPPVTDGDAESALVDENAKDPAEQVLSSKNSDKSSHENNNIRFDTNSKPSASRPKQNNYVAVSSKPISVASKSERSSVKVAGSVRERLALLQAKQDLARMRLDEEEKRRKEDSDARLKRLSMEEDFLREKLEIIDRAESVLESEWSRTHKVRKWLDKQKKDGPELEEEDNAVGGRKPEGNSSPVRHPEVMVARSCSSANRHNRHSTRLSDCSSRTAAQEHRVSTRLPQRSSHNENSWKGPTAEQIAARNIWPKKLPTFSGDPETWPLFINTYENGNIACGFSNTENLIRLQESLQGNARAVVQMKLMEPKCVPSIIEVLKQLFGRPELLIKALLANLRKVSAPHPENLESLLSFGVAVTQVCDYLETAKLDAHLSNPTILAELVAKLPSSYQMEWVRYKRACNECTLKEFGEFMQLLIFDASEVTTITSGKLKPIMFDKIQSSKGHFHTHMESEVEVKPKGARIPCVSCARTDHRLQNCDVFKRLTVPERKKLIEKEKLCSLCFFGHTSECNSKRRCGVNQCSERHHPLLHPERLAGEESREQRQTGGRRDNGGPSYVTANCNVHRPAKRAILFHVVPVTLHNGENQIDVLAFLDDGSSLSLLEANVASKIGIQGIHQPLEMTWTSNVTRSETASQNVRIQISPRGSNTKIQMWNVHTVNRLNLPSQSMNTSIMRSKFKHLKGLPVDSYAAEEPKLLIGLDHADLLYPIESRKGLPGEPIAVRSALGWSVFGPVGDELPVAEYCNVHRCACENLDERLRQFYAIEEAGIDIGNQPEKDADRRAREILEATTTRIGKRFETGLLWRTSDVKFPSSSYAMAEKRLRSLEHRLAKSEELRDNVHSQINQYIQKGYAHIASEEELTKTSPEKTWYLPVNIVLNPKKPNKVRLVWDAAAKIEGVSLNSLLLKGPDLLTALPTVLSRFRERNIGFGGDIAEMFHQVRIRNDDKHAQRFCLGRIH